MTLPSLMPSCNSVSGTQIKLLRGLYVLSIPFISNTVMDDDARRGGRCCLHTQLFKVYLIWSLLTDNST